jgi:hypothetical protein
MTMGTIAVLATFLTLAAGCSEDPPSPQQRCDELRDHLVNLRLSDVSTPDVDLAAHRSAMTAALGTRFVDNCVSAFTDKQIRCVMAATDSQTAADCSR